MSEDAQPSLIDYLTRHYGTLKRRVARVLGSSELASDALHDAWLRLKTRQVDGPVHSPASYLTRMIVNLAIDLRRQQGRIVSLEDIGAARLDLTDPAPGTGQSAEARLEMEALIRLVERMPPRQREVFVLVHWEGLLQDEVARRLGCSKRTVEYELKYAHDHLIAEMNRG